MTDPDNVESLFFRIATWFLAATENAGKSWRRDVWVRSRPLIRLGSNLRDRVEASLSGSPSAGSIMILEPDRRPMGGELREEIA